MLERNAGASTPRPFRSSAKAHRKHRLNDCLALTVIAVMASSVSAIAADKSQVMLIVDGSGSMWGEAAGDVKIMAARRLLGELLDELPSNIDVGLMAYGHRQKGRCDDIEVLSEPGQGSREDLRSQLAAISPRGKTPIAGALKAAGERLRQSEVQTSLVLVSDGLESCGGDPCAQAAQLVELGIDLNVHVVGYDVDQVAGEQLSCIAKNGNGLYFSASDSEQLGEALSKVEERLVAAEPVVTTIDIASAEIWLERDVIGGVDLISADTEEKIARLTGTTRKQVPPGRYRLEFPHYTSEAFDLADQDEREVQVEDYPLATVSTTRETIGGVDLIDASTGQKLLRMNGTTQYQIPAGQYRLEFPYFESEPVDIDVGSNVQFSASDHELATVGLADDTIGGVDLIDIQSEKRRLRMTGTTRYQIPPGDYRLEFAHYDTDPVEILKNDNKTFSAREYGLATVSKTRSIPGGLDVMDGEERVVRLTGTTRYQIPPGTYRLVHPSFTLENVVIAPAEERVFATR